MSRTVRFAVTAAAAAVLSSLALPAAYAATPQHGVTVSAVQSVTPDYTCGEHIECDPK